MEGPHDIAPGRVVAGIDEAGYGPMLGPLVIGATAWLVPDDCDGADLWQRLRGGVSKKPSKRFARVAINDSKKLYSRSKGLADLERGVLATWAVRDGAAAGAVPAAWPDLLARLAPGLEVDLDEHPWYAGYESLPLPQSADAADVATRANGLRVALGRASIRFLGAGLEPVLEGRFNRLYDAIGNKGTMLFSCTARLIQRLLDRFGHRRPTIICDKHGGRNSYRAILQRHWPQMRLTVIEEGPQRSAYELADPPSRDGAAGRSAELWFLPEADATYLPVALASMYCKYTRELFMGLFNGFWRRHAPAAAPTAGYYADGRRFVREVADAAGRLGLPRERFIRRH